MRSRSGLLFTLAGLLAVPLWLLPPEALSEATRGKVFVGMFVVAGIAFVQRMRERRDD